MSRIHPPPGTWYGGVKWAERRRVPDERKRHVHGDDDLVGMVQVPGAFAVCRCHDSIWAGHSSLGDNGKECFECCG